MQTLPEKDLSSANNQIQNHNNYNEDHEHGDEMFKAHVIKSAVDWVSDHIEIEVKVMMPILSGRICRPLNTSLSTWN